MYKQSESSIISMHNEIASDFLQFKALFISLLNWVVLWGLRSAVKMKFNFTV